jgi:MFS transporter, DHA2 family, multidrug resistance protein
MTDPNAGWTPKHNRWAVAITVTLATFMEVLDSSIANVALPHIAGSLAASQEESTWVLTSYLVSNAIVLPISAWLANRFGRKRFYMSCVALFTVSSALCGMAPTLGLLVLFRILQGIGGGGLAPSEQAILADTFPPKMRGMAFAMYGMAVVCAPAIGPTLGGWITDNFAWNWIFYINLPVGLLSLYLTNRLVEDPPYLKEESRKSRGIPVDWTGLGLISVGIGCLQVALDKGQELDWFSSPVINMAFAVALISLVTFVWWEWHHRDPIVAIRLFKGRNFATAMVFTFALGVVLYGTTVLIPQFLQLLLGYSAVNAGKAISGGGLMMMVMMPIAGILVSRVDPRYMMVCGFGMTALSLFHMSTHLTLGIDFGTAAMLRVYQTMGLAFIFIPSNTLAYVGIPRTKNNQVSGMNAFIRNIGGSIGIAVISTFLTRLAQMHQTYMVVHAHAGNPVFDSMMRGVPQQQGYARVYQTIQAQASNLAYVDIVRIMAVVVTCLIPLVFLMRRGAPPAGDAPPAH